MAANEEGSQAAWDIVPGCAVTASDQHWNGLEILSWAGSRMAF